MITLMWLNGRNQACYKPVIRRICRQNSPFDKPLFRTTGTPIIFYGLIFIGRLDLPEKNNGKKP